MAVDNLDQMVKSGELPNNPKVLEAIRADASGKTLEKVKLRHKEASAPAPVADVKSAIPPLPSKDSVLNQLLSKGEIPNNPKVLEAIASGKVDVEQVKRRHAEFKQTTPVVSVTSEGKVNDVETIKQAAVNPETITNNPENDFIAMYDFSSPGTPVTSYLPATKAEANQMRKVDAFQGNAFIKGLSFGTVDLSSPTMAEYQPTGEEKVAAGVMNVMGGFITGGPLFKGIGFGLSKIPGYTNMVAKGAKLGSTIKELKDLRTVAKASGALDDASAAGKALFGARASKAGIEVGKTIAESAIAGGMVGAAKSTIQGNDWTTVLADAVNESAWFTAYGLAALPVFSILGKVIGLRQERRVKKTLEATAKLPEAQALAKEGISPAFTASVKDEVVGPLTEGQMLAKMAVEKIKATNPTIGLPTKLLANPQLMSENLKASAADISSQLFGPKGPLKNLLASNPNLKVLVDAGKHAEALDSVQTTMADLVSKNPDVKNYALAPFANNAKTLHDVYANRLVDTVKNPERFPNLQRNILNYFDAPTPENALLLQGKNAPRKFFEKVQKETFKDARLSPIEIDTLVHDSFKGIMETLSGNAKPALSQNLFGSLKSTDEIFKTAVTFNKELSRKFITAYSENPYSIDSYFIKAKPELAEGIQNSANLQRLNAERNIAMNTRREQNMLMREMQAELKVTVDPSRKQELGVKLNTLKDQLQSVNQTLTQQNQSIREINTSLAGYKPEQMKEIQGFVSEIYVSKRSGTPFKEELSKKMAAKAQAKAEARSISDEISEKVIAVESKYQPKIENSADFKARYDAENPYFLRADTELADVMNAFMVSGKDISQKNGKAFLFDSTSPFGININNIRRQMQKEFGPNNFMEKFLNEATDASANIEDNMKSFSKQIDDLGIKSRSVESAWVQKIGEKRALPTDPEFLALKPSQQENVLNSISYGKKFYTEFIEMLNTTHRANRLPEIPVREDFFTHFGEINTSLPNLLSDLAKGNLKDDLIDFAKGGRMGQWKPAAFDPNRTFFRSEKARSGGEFKDDAITGMKLYMRSALERIHYAGLIRKIDVAKQFAPPELSNFMQSFKDDFLLKSPNFIDKKADNVFKKIAQTGINRLGRGAILGNVNVLLQQLTSTPLNFTMAPIHGVKALGQMVTKEGRKIAALSKNLKTRDSLHLEIDREAKLLEQTIFKGPKVEAALNTIGKPVEYYAKFGEWSMGILDGIAARHAFLTGYSKGKASGLTNEQAARFGDKWTEMTQSNPTRMGQPEIYQSVTAKTVLQFTSFTTNLAATLLNDMPTIARTEGASKAVAMFVKTIGGAMIANESCEKMGIPAPFDLVKMIPFINNYRFGVGGLPSIPYNAIMAVAGDEQTSKKAKTGLVRTAGALIAPGGGQVAKTVDVINREFKGEYKGNDGQFYKDLAFGKSAKKKKEDRDAMKFKTRKFFRDRIKKQINGKVEE